MHVRLYRTEFCSLNDIYIHIYQQNSFVSDLGVLFLFSCLIALARTSSSMLNRSGKNGYVLCLVSDLTRKKVKYFNTEYDVSYGLVI